MHRCRIAIAVVGFALLTAIAADDAPLTIKLRDPQAGDRVRVTESAKDTSVSLFEVMGNKQEKVEKKGRAVVYVEDVITAGEPGKKPAKVMRVYEKAEVMKDGKTEKGPLDDKTVLIEKKGTKYEFTDGNGGALDGPAAAELDREFNKGSVVKATDLIPSKPVKSGDAWNLDKAKLLKEMAGDSGMAFDLDKATATAKLLKTYPKDCKQFGVIEMKLEAPIKALSAKNAVTPKDGSAVSMTITVDLCIDGSDSTTNSSSKAVYKVEATTSGVDVKVTVEAEQSAKREPLPKP
jgi:hypothetical protein